MPGCLKNRKEEFKLKHALKINITDAQRDKIDRMYEAGLNVSQLIRNYISAFSIEEATKIFN